MRDRPDVKTVFSDILKLAIYLLFSVGAMLFSFGGVPLWLAPFLPAAACIVITLVFLILVEQRSRSFFATGYMLENILLGGVAGIVSFALIAAAEYMQGSARFTGLPENIDPGKLIVSVFSGGLLAGIVIFGYFYHIISRDIGFEAAIILSALLYGLGFAGGFGADPLTAANLVLLGAAAGCVQYYLGDVRSSAAFLCLFELASDLYSLSFKSEADGLFGSMMWAFGRVSPAIILAAVCVLFYMAAKKRSEKR